MLDGLHHPSSIPGALTMSLGQNLLIPVAFALIAIPVARVAGQSDGSPQTYAAAGRSGTSSERTAPFANAGTRYRSLRIDGVRVFYREAGPVDAPVIVLLH